MLANSQRSGAARWDEVRVFLALYRARTLAGAGAALALDASTVSRRLAALEAALATSLFDRTPDGLVATESAELLLPAAEEMAAAHARFVDDAAAFERAVEGSVRLSVPPGLAEAFVVPALVRLRAKYPRLHVELDASIRFSDLTRREADIAVRTRRPEVGDLVSVKLGERRFTPMMARSRARKLAPVKAWDELAWIAWADDMQSFPPAAWLRRHVSRSAVVLSTSAVAAQVRAVEAGLGVALLPPVQARFAKIAPIRAAPALAASLAELPVSETWLVGHRSLRAVPRVAAVWTFLAEEFARFEAVPHAKVRRVALKP